MMTQTDGQHYPGPSRKQIADKIEALGLEIKWNIDRLGYLVMSDEDRQQTEDFIIELRKEKQSLEWCFGNVTR